MRIFDFYFFKISIAKIVLNIAFIYRFFVENNIFKWHNDVDIIGEENKIDKQFFYQDFINETITIFKIFTIKKNK